MNKACMLQQGEKSIIAYANELSSIFGELDHYRPPINSSGDRDYILMDRVYKLFQGLKLEFEGIRSQLYNRETSLTFDDAVSQLLNEESQLQDMRGGAETSAYSITQSKPPAVNQPSQPPPQLIPHSITNYFNYGMVSTSNTTFLATLNQVTIPTTIEEAFQYP